MNKSNSIDCCIDLDVTSSLSDQLLYRVVAPHLDDLRVFDIDGRGGQIHRERFLSLWATLPDRIPKQLHQKFVTILDLILIEQPCLLQSKLLESNIAYEEYHTAGDLAALVALELPSTTSQLIATYQPTRHRKVSCYIAHQKAVPHIPADLDERVEAFRAALSDKMGDQLRTRCVRVYPARSGSQLALKVLRGDGARRQSVIDIETEKPESLVFNPESCDIITYDSQFGDVRIHSQRISDTSLYRSYFGRYFFGNDSAFTMEGCSRYFNVAKVRDWLKPRMTCRDVIGLEDVVTTSVGFIPSGARCSPVYIMSQDGLEHMASNITECMPRNATMCSINLCFRLRDGRSRRVRIEQPNVITLFDDEDAALILKWLRARGIIQTHLEAFQHVTEFLWGVA